ncbi:MAG: UDP-N-acetylglucosamine 2-epimerase (non-hydrolyzing) [Candidatus Atribacteria bacterium]|nr:UDP-N-acetylglucosamine 2-epimerase (non-hydrolyzing) [Candidatus Atribacteria bacterium]
MGKRVPKKCKVVFVLGTRPEVVKVAPVYQLFSRREDFHPLLINTGQHREMSDRFLHIFDITPDYTLDVMSPGQTLSALTARILQDLEPILSIEKPDIVLVQGDTTSALGGALSAFYQHILVGHIEAGLRTGNKYSPFPEEMNRVLIGRVADFHFAPTEHARGNLLRENIPAGQIVVTGNTVVDALLLIKEKITAFIDPHLSTVLSQAQPQAIVTVTAHRRESWDGGIRNISFAVRELALQYPRTLFFFSVHPNPLVRDQVYAILSTTPNVHLLDPLDYRDFIFLLSQSTLAISDSGGVQEEAPSLGVPVLVTREFTERPEILEAGAGFLVGTDTKTIIKKATEVLSHPQKIEGKSIFGDGRASERIAEVLQGIRSSES